MQLQLQQQQHYHVATNSLQQQASEHAPTQSGTISVVPQSRHQQSPNEYPEQNQETVSSTGSSAARIGVPVVPNLHLVASSSTSSQNHHQSAEAGQSHQQNHTLDGRAGSSTSGAGNAVVDSTEGTNFASGHQRRLDQHVTSHTNPLFQVVILFFAYILCCIASFKIMCSLQET